MLNVHSFCSTTAEAEAISFHHPPAPVAQQPSGGDEKQPMATTMSQTLQVHEPISLKLMAIEVI